MEGFTMLRKLALIIIVLASQSAYAFSGSFTAKVTQSSKHEKATDTFGILLSQPIALGLGWWSWNGFGATFQNDQNPTRWMSTTQGLDLNIKKMCFGVTAKFKYDDSTNESDAEYGVRMSVDLW